MLDVSRHQLTFAGIDLTGTIDYGGFKFFALAEGSTLGNPEPVTRKLASALLDGSLMETTRHDNRTANFQVMVEAADSSMIDAAQKMLFRACGARSTLVWQPPDGYGAVRVYIVQNATLDHIFDDLDELRRAGMAVRRYRLSLSCHPWAYNEEPTRIVAEPTPPSSPVTTTMFDGTSAVGWTSPAGATAQPVVVSGKVQIAPMRELQHADYPHLNDFTIALGAAVDFSATPYLTMDLKPLQYMGFCVPPEPEEAFGYAVKDYRGDDPKENPYNWFDMYIDGSRVPLKHYETLSDGTLRCTWLTTDTSATTVRLTAGTHLSGWFHPDLTEPAGTSRGFTVDNVKRSNVLPGSSATGKQLLLTLDYEGSARDSASITVEHETRTLGEVVIYSSPDLERYGYQPSCKGFAITGGHTVTADTEAVSGSWVRSSNSTPMAWEIPASRLPRGSYAVRLRYRWWQTSTDVIDVSDFGGKVMSTVNGETIFETALPVRAVMSSTVKYNYGTDLNPVRTDAQPPQPILTMGVVHLPQNDVASDATTALVRIELDSLGNNPNYEVDDLWLYYLGDGSDYSHIFCGNEVATVNTTSITGWVYTPLLGTRHNRLFMDQPTPTNARPRLTVGTQADRSDGYNPGFPTVKAYGKHPVLPGANRIHVVSTAAPYPKVTLETYEADF